MKLKSIIFRRGSNHIFQDTIFENKLFAKIHTTGEFKDEDIICVLNEERVHSYQELRASIGENEYDYEKTVYSK